MFAGLTSGNSERRLRCVTGHELKTAEKQALAGGLMASSVLCREHGLSMGVVGSRHARMTERGCRVWLGVDRAAWVLPDEYSTAYEATRHLSSLHTTTRSVLSCGHERRLLTDISDRRQPLLTNSSRWLLSLTRHRGGGAVQALNDHSFK